MTHLWLIGMMGAGKTAVGEHVAAALDLPFVDVDAEIAGRLGCSIGQLWGERGEAAFRDMEEAAVARIAAGRAAVVATGGGVVLRDANVAAMRASGLVVWLQAAPAVLAERVGDGSGRPLLEAGDVAARLGAILSDRNQRYVAAAHEIIDGAADVADVAARVVELWTGY